MQASELWRVILAGTAFFLILCSYYIVRPVRDEMAVQYGADKLHWLFTGTLLATLIAVPSFAWVVKHMPRNYVLPAVYAFFVVNLLVFFSVFYSGAITAISAAAFFIWLSVFSLFAVSLFWSTNSDLFTAVEARRLYAYIAAGGTGGALAGPAIAALLAQQVDTAVLLGLAALLLLAATLCMAALRLATPTQPGVYTKPIGGSLFAGLWLTIADPKLRAIAILTICYTAISTLLYIELVDLVGKTYTTAGERTVFFATLDLIVNGIALGIQLLGTRFIVQRYGLRLALMSIPLLLLACLAVLGVWHTLIGLAAVQVLHRAGEYALSRPGREMLYTSVEPESRYKAKNFIDTAVYRANDAASAWLLAAVRALGLNVIAAVGLPVLVTWLCFAFKLGAQDRQMEERSETHGSA